MRTLPHSTSWRVLVPLAAVLTLPIIGRGQTTIPAPDLLRPITGVQDPDPHGIKRSQAVRVDVGLLRRVQPGHVLRMRLFHDAIFDARFETVDVEPHVPDTFHWRGRLLGHEGSHFVITVHENACAAWVFPNDAKFESLAIQGDSGNYFARELKDSAHGCHGGLALTKDLIDRSVTGPLAACNDNPDKVRVLLCYDSTARSKGETAVRAAILNGLAIANTALRNTNLSISWIAATTPRWVSYTTSGTTRTDLDRLTHIKGHKDDPSGHMDVVHDWRKSYDADLVALVPGNLSGGIAWCAGTAGSWKSGFSVTGYKSLGAQTLTHEIGHNYGCAHDPVNTDCKPTSYGRGHNWLVDETGFPVYSRVYRYSVMSYSSNWGSCSFPWGCSKARQPVFSSPFIYLTHNGKRFATGTSTRDNRRVIVARRQNIANYSIYVRGGNKPPVITTQPKSTSICNGYVADNTLLLTCSVNGYGNAVQYQWRKDGRIRTGQTSSRLIVSTTPFASNYAGRWDCVVTTCAGSVTSNVAVISLDANCRSARGAAAKSGPGFGSVVCNAGDMDRDGTDDFVAGHPHATNQTVKDGAIHFGTGDVGRFTRGSFGVQNQEVGAALASGDVDGDGHSDVVYGAPGALSGQGCVFWHSGATRRGQYFLRGYVPGARLGTALDLAQLDADSRPDLIVVGKDTIYAHTSRPPMTNPWPKLWSVTPLPGVAIRSIATIGDVNGDGRDDFVIGLPSYQSNRGRWELRSGVNGARLRAYNGSPGEMIGFSLAATGDLNGDRVPDFVVGAPGKNSDKGLFLTVSGATGGFLTYSFGTVVGNRLGYALSAAGGDLNGDGVPDILVSEIPTSASLRGRVRAVSGKSVTTTLWTRSGASQMFGAAIAGLDSNGDSKPDVLIGEPMADKGFVWLYDSTVKKDAPRFDAYGDTCLGSGNRYPRLTHNGIARVASTHEIALHGMLPGSAAHLMLGVGRANVPLDALGMKGCKLLIKTKIAGFTRPTGNGRTAVRFATPNDASLIGARVTWQNLVLDAKANSFGLTLSNAGELTIGAKL